MKDVNNKKGLSQPKIRFNHYTGNNMEGEAFVSDHIFSYIISGTHDTWVGDKLYSFQAGDYRFFRRNQLTKYSKRPAQEGFKSIAVYIDQNTLKEISHEHGLTADTPYIGNDILLLKRNQYLERYIDSLMPYINSKNERNEKIVLLKAKELILLLLETNPALKEMLFDFSDPGKINLEAFMNTHYRYNVGIDRFAFLTGRSLSGFKRDFEKLFNTTPGKWLVQKRLEEAHYLIAKKNKRPSEIYLDLGFLDLSHFSFAYKKAFGTAPTRG
ncbi:MAG TPA: AraC family transcriptional regulator [Ohtaekwangia sp.]|uniref:helix-turn-helix domain-containing protein n=1 Tax=Ohtaekwangia sp. TaxID=2066019 RepID=UPI002F91C98A